MRSILPYSCLCLTLLLCSGCSVHRIYCHLDGDTHMQEFGHTPVCVRLSPDNTERYVGADMWARSFVLQFQGTLEAVHGSYRYGSGDSAPIQPLEVASVSKHSAVLIPSASVGLYSGSYQKIECMKEGRYVLDVAYRMDGRDYEYHGALVYKRKGDVGVQWMTGSADQW
jgi:hypothetical protein